MIKLFISLILFLCPLWGMAETLKVCVDEREWRPFTYFENDVAKGILVDMVKEAVSRQRLNVEFAAMPWRRCLLESSEGKYDAILPLAFSKENDKDFLFPKAAGTKNHEAALMQIDHALITFMDAKTANQYEYRGDLKSLPEPVRVPIGDSIIPELEKKQINIEPGKGDSTNVSKLLRDKKGSVITTTILAETFDRNPDFKSKIKIHPVPINSQPYYLAFYKSSHFASGAQKALWQELLNVRNDYLFMLSLFAQY